MSKIAAKGIVIKHGPTATPTDILAQVKEVALIGGDREMIDTTTQDSSGTKDSIPNPLRDVRGLEVTLLYDPVNAGHEAIRAAQAAATPYYFTYVAPDTGAAQWAMLGIITKFSLPTMGVDGAFESTFTFMATAAETFTA